MNDQWQMSEIQKFKEVKEVASFVEPRVEEDFATNRQVWKWGGWNVSTLRLGAFARENSSRVVGEEKSSGSKEFKEVKEAASFVHP